MSHRIIDPNYLPRLIRVKPAAGPAKMSISMMNFSTPVEMPSQRKYFSDAEVIAVLSKRAGPTSAEFVAEQLNVELGRLQKRLRQLVQAGALIPRVARRAGGMAYELNPSMQVVDMTNARAAAGIVWESKPPAGQRAGLPRIERTSRVNATSTIYV
jgi:hypothetical protein